MSSTVFINGSKRVQHGSPLDQVGGKIVLGVIPEIECTETLSNRGDNLSSVKVRDPRLGENCGTDSANQMRSSGRQLAGKGQR